MLSGMSSAERMPMMVTAATISTRVMPASRCLMPALYRFAPEGEPQDRQRRQSGQDQAVAGGRGSEAHHDRVRARRHDDGAKGDVRPIDGRRDAVDLRLPTGI